MLSCSWVSLQGSSRILSLQDDGGCGSSRLSLLSELSSVPRSQDVPLMMSCKELLDDGPERRPCGCGFGLVCSVLCAVIAIFNLKLIIFNTTNQVNKPFKTINQPCGFISVSKIWSNGQRKGPSCALRVFFSNSNIIMCLTGLFSLCLLQHTYVN